MVAEPSMSCVGMEYFCFAGDDLWDSKDEDLIAFATEEIGRCGLVDPATVVDGAVVRAPKAYPIYDFGYEDHLVTIREYLGKVAPNVEVCGRNGMHRYNNQDHAMLTGLIAARNIAGVRLDQWRVNEDAEYLEEEAEVGIREVPKPIR
jgi:protoporphyrinogen oxidase